jgi:hypothetical protein
VEGGAWDVRFDEKYVYGGFVEMMSL